MLTRKSQDSFFLIEDGYRPAPAMRVSSPSSVFYFQENDMRLTRKKQIIKLCIELWTWLAKTGKMKSQWPEWEKYPFAKEYPYCWFCYFDNNTLAGRPRKGGGGCVFCPYYKKYGHCNSFKTEPPFYKWNNVTTPRTRKKYAKLFLEQIKALQRGQETSKVAQR